MTHRSQWPSGLRPLNCSEWGFESPRGHGCLVSCECCVLSGRGLCDGPIARPDQSHRLWNVTVSDLASSRMKRPWTALCQRKKSNDIIEDTAVVHWERKLHIVSCDSSCATTSRIFVFSSSSFAADAAECADTFKIAGTFMTFKF